ncbi:MAG TPA: AAA family ATPase [Longimicrobiaceae bacterium]|nr:AAA family ATPase [Longimicrobiaceae bacterium]
MAEPYPARRLLEEHGITLGALAAGSDWSRTTWSRFLRRRLDREPAGIRPAFEAILLGRGLGIPLDLWGVAEASPDEPQTTGEIGMRGQILLDDARTAFRLFRSPFDSDAMVNGAHDRLHELYVTTPRRFAEARLVQAFTGAGFVALYGEPGTGKSTLLERARRLAAERKPLEVIRPANVERRKMTAAHISGEIIRQLSTESVPRTHNVRDAAATEILMQQYQQGRRVALVIDEAHELPSNTIKDLKRYHELSDGYIRLLAVILVGQTELADRLDRDRNHSLREAIIRCQLIHLPPLREKGDVRGYMETRFRWVSADLDAVWEREAVDELERKLAEHDQQLPVIIGNCAMAAMNLAYQRGNERVTADEVIDLWAASAAQLRGWGLA